MPSLIRTDYVANSNDSYWLANASAPAAQQEPIIGPVGIAQNLRTRSGILTIEGQIAGQGPAQGSKIDPAAVQAMLYRNDNLAAELVLPDLGHACGDSRPGDRRERALGRHRPSLHDPGSMGPAHEPGQRQPAALHRVLEGRREDPRTSGPRPSTPRTRSTRPAASAPTRRSPPSSAPP